MSTPVNTCVPLDYEVTLVQAGTKVKSGFRITEQRHQQATLWANAGLFTELGSTSPSSL